MPSIPKTKSLFKEGIVNMNWYWELDLSKAKNNLNDSTNVKILNANAHFLFGLNNNVTAAIRGSRNKFAILSLLETIYNLQAPSFTRRFSVK